MQRECSSIKHVERRTKRKKPLKHHLRFLMLKTITHYEDVIIIMSLNQLYSSKFHVMQMTRMQ